MATRRQIATGGLLALAGAVFLNFFVNYSITGNYDLKAEAVRQSAREADQRAKGFLDAQPFVDPIGPGFMTYYKKVDEMQQRAADLEEEAFRLDKKAEKSFRRAFIYGYLSD